MTYKANKLRKVQEEVSYLDKEVVWEGKRIIAEVYLNVRDFSYPVDNFCCEAKQEKRVFGEMLSDIDYDKIIKAMIESIDSSQYTPSKFRELEYNTKEVISSFIFLDYSVKNSFIYNDNLIFKCSNNKSLIQKFYNEYSQFFITPFNYIFERIDKIGTLNFYIQERDNWFGYKPMAYYWTLGLGHPNATINESYKHKFLKNFKLMLEKGAKIDDTNFIYLDCHDPNGWHDNYGSGWIKAKEINLDCKNVNITQATKNPLNITYDDVKNIIYKVENDYGFAKKDYIYTGIGLATCINTVPKDKAVYCGAVPIIDLALDYLGITSKYQLSSFFISYQAIGKAYQHVSKDIVDKAKHLLYISYIKPPVNIFEAMPIADKIVGGIGMVGEIEDDDATGSVIIQRAPSLYDEIKESAKEDYEEMQEILVNKIGNILRVNNAILAGQYIKGIYDYTIDTVYYIFSPEVDDV